MLASWLVENICHKKDAGFRFALVILERHHAGGSGVVERLPTDVQSMVGLHRRDLRPRLFLDSFLNSGFYWNSSRGIFMLRGQRHGNNEKAAECSREQSTIQEKVPSAVADDP